MNIYKIQSQLAQALTELGRLRGVMHSRGVSLVSKIVCYFKCVALKHRIQRLTNKLHPRGAS